MCILLHYLVTPYIGGNFKTKEKVTNTPASILYKSIAGRYRPVSYPDGPITARYIFIKNAYWDILPAKITAFFIVFTVQVVAAT